MLRSSKADIMNHHGPCYGDLQRLMSWKTTALHTSAAVQRCQNLLPRTIVSIFQKRGIARHSLLWWVEHELDTLLNVALETLVALGQELLLVVVGVLDNVDCL